MADRAAARRAKHRVAVADKVSGYAAGSRTLHTSCCVCFARNCQRHDACNQPNSFGFHFASSFVGSMLTSIVHRASSVPTRNKVDTFDSLIESMQRAGAPIFDELQTADIATIVKASPRHISS